MSRILLVGGGPSAISARLWFHDLETPITWWTAGHALGGTLLRVGNPIEVYAGLPARNGQELAAAMSTQVTRLGLQPAFGHRVTSLNPIGERWEVHVASAATTRRDVFDHVILGTGTRPRLLNLPEERALLERGVEISVTRRRDNYRDQTVAVVGGGDAALEGALLLTEVGCKVHLIHRNDHFRAQDRFVRALSERPQVTLHLGNQVTQLVTEEGRLLGVHLSSGKHLKISGLFVRIGVEPALPSGVPATVIDRSTGYVIADANGGTHLPGLHAIGDVCSPEHQSVAWACGMGARRAWGLRA